MLCRADIKVYCGWDYTAGLIFIQISRVQKNIRLLYGCYNFLQKNIIWYCRYL